MTTLDARKAPPAGAIQPRRRGKKPAILGRLSSFAIPVLIVAAVFGLWQLFVTITEPRPDILPGPGRVIRAGWSQREAIWQNTVPTILETVIGVGIAIVIGTLIATALSFSTRVRSALLPVLIGAQAVPIIVIAPLFVIWMGFGLLPKVLVVVLVTFFPLAVSILQGLLSADVEGERLLKSMGASSWKIYRRLRVPSALPFFFSGLRVVASYAVVAAIFSEYVGADKGLGIYMQLQKNYLRTDLVLAAVLVSVVISVVLFSLTYLLEAIVMPWERRRKAGLQ